MVIQLHDSKTQEFQVPGLTKPTLKCEGSWTRNQNSWILPRVQLLNSLVSSDVGFDFSFSIHKIWIIVALLALQHFF